MSLAAVRIWYEHNWYMAEKELKRAIELKPEFPSGHALYVRLLDVTGRFDEAIAESRRSAGVDPHGPQRAGAGKIGPHYFHARRYDLAAEEFLKDIKENPGNGPNHISLGEVYIQQKKFKEALAEARTASALVGRNPRQSARLGALFAAAGDAEEAAKILVEAQKLASHRPFMAYSIALIYTALGNNDEAIAWLNKSIDEFDAGVIDLKVDPRFDSLRRDSRFNTLLGRMHFLP